MIVYDLAARPFLHAKAALQFIVALTVVCLFHAKICSGQIQRIPALSGVPGGRLNCSLRAEPKTLNPIYATDISSRTVTSIMNADLLHINRKTNVVESALAQSWEVTRDAKTYTLHLRHNLLFSDGAPFTADDVLFSFHVYLDAELNAPQRDLLIIDGHPIEATKLDSSTVRIDLVRPYAAAARLFDGLAMLPRHLLEPLEKSGKLKDAWTSATPPTQLAGLGPFRLKVYKPGEALTFERNPYYWKQDRSGRMLPYLDEVTFAILTNQDAESLRFSAGQLDLISRLSADVFAPLSKQASTHSFQMLDGGPGLEFDFLLFNLNTDVTGKLAEAAHTQKWFSQVAFRQALSLAVDRAALVHLVFQDRAYPLNSPVTPASRAWADSKSTAPARDLPRSRSLLAASGFQWHGGALTDPNGDRVKFTILAPSSNRQRSEIASLLRQDFSALGIDVQVVSLEFRSLLQRVTQSHDYDTAVMGLSAGDTDPNGNLSLWLSDGSLHLWNLGQKHPATSWESDIDAAMQQQLFLVQAAERKKAFVHVQEIYQAQLPFISLVSPNMLGAARVGLTGVSSSALDPAMLDNIAAYYWKQ